MISQFCRTVLRNKNNTGIRYYAKNPVEKTLNIIAKDIPSYFGSKDNSILYPEHTDIVIIGGGFIGSAIAYWLKKRAADGLSVVVLEKDFSYTNAQNSISLGTLTQHFSLPENIELAKYSVEFLRNIHVHLGHHMDIQYTPTGALTLASEEYAQKMEQNVTMLNELGIKNILLTPSEIKEKYPWINTDDVKLGCMATEAEGTFDSWALLRSLVTKSRELGANYVNGEVVGFELEKQKDVLMEGVTPGGYERLNRVIYKTEDQEEHSIKFAICVLAAGSDSGDIARMAKIGTGENILSVPLPIEERTSDIYSIQDKAVETGLRTPLVMDTTGLWLMRNGLGNDLLCGTLPLMTDDTKNVSKKEYLENVIKPSLINRFPICKNDELERFSTDKYDCNTYDNSGIIGPHSYHNNLFLATGFGKLGCQHAPGIGRAVTELIIDSQYTTIDLTRFGFDRFLVDERSIEFNVY
ncbi:FAD-dependent oxidoreductase domain-containing protein 1-like [Spodoptera litura]|uniref:FAD-dependent oxidoreductase domain-containing protein 1 n=1 Tax=Spodoptera litura TaxID=69820 RepID=A0A9J7DXP1_SPOLT|nr:FAD-dependent oxidoreductase domain-containing protein 1-like [Spodoptera litura]